MTGTPHGSIGVLVVDDSPFMRLTIQKILSQDSSIRVLDTARDGREGIEKLKALRPQVVTMDIEMPVINGLQALDEIMRWQPTPVIVLSSLTTQGAEATLKALDLGAFDVVAKPSGGPGADLNALANELTEKIKAAAGVNTSRLGQRTTYPAAKEQNVGATQPGITGRLGLPGTGWTGKGREAGGTSPSDGIGQMAKGTGNVTGATVVGNPVVSPDTSGDRMPGSGMVFPRHKVEIVAIGTSTGGPSALQTVLPYLPANFPVPVIVAQHMPPGFTAPLAQRLNGSCPLAVREGVPGEPLRAGTIYIAPAGKQMQVKRQGGQLVLHIGDESPIPTLYHPSVDVMFFSLAKEVGRGTLGVIMTGMGNDGVKGMKEIKSLEGFAIAEAEETCVVYGMPKAIVDAGLADRVVPLGEIGRTIVKCVLRR